MELPVRWKVGSVSTYLLDLISGIVRLKLTFYQGKKVTNPTIM